MIKAQEVCGSFESETMIESIKQLDKELIEIKKAAVSASLKPLPGETVIITRFFFFFVFLYFYIFDYDEESIF